MLQRTKVMALPESAWAEQPPRSVRGKAESQMDDVPTHRKPIVFGSSDRPRSRLSDAPDRGSRDLRCQSLCTPSRAVRTNYGLPQVDRPPREDVPLPTSPPYTAFIGNLSFDVTESEMAAFFGGHEVRCEPPAKTQIRHSSSHFADQVHKNHQGRGWQAKGIWLH